MNAISVTTGAVQHIVLPVGDVGRAADFYCKLLGFQAVTDVEAVTLLTNGHVTLTLRPRAAEESAWGYTQFGLSLRGHDELEAAARLLTDSGVRHQDIRHYADMGVYVLSLHDPDDNLVDLIVPSRKG
jgi:catechol-2,3-dioxygenase